MSIQLIDLTRHSDICELKIRKDHERLLTALHRGGINHKVLNQLMYGEYSTYRTSMKGDWIEDVPDWSTTTNHGDVDPSASPTTQKRVFADYMSAALSPKPTSAHIATRVKQLQATLSAYKLDEDSKESPTSSGDESEDGHGSVDEQDIDIATKQQDHVDPDVNAGDFDKSDDGGVRLHMT